jgi:hypothetical protein
LSVFEVMVALEDVVAMHLVHAARAQDETRPRRLERREAVAIHLNGREELRERLLEHVADAWIGREQLVGRRRERLERTATASSKRSSGWASLPRKAGRSPPRRTTSSWDVGTGRRLRSVFPQMLDEGLEACPLIREGAPRAALRQFLFAQAQRSQVVERVQPALQFFALLLAVVSEPLVDRR